MSQPIISPTFLFNFSWPCKKVEWGRAAQLDDSRRLPSFGELEGKPIFADVRAGWSEKGLIFVVDVSGKKQAPWCRDTRIDDSDGLFVWIDTRNAKGVHRAGRFCHRFGFLPAGGGRNYELPVAELLQVRRAKQDPKAAPPDTLAVEAAIRQGGYKLTARIGAEALTGFDPEEHPQLGFTYAVIDRENGWQTFSVGPELPFTDDPSLWGELELVS